MMLMFVALLLCWPDMNDVQCATTAKFQKSTMNAPTARGLAAKAPEKGSFPLDHGGACKLPMKEFQDCIKKNKGSHALCRDFSKKYLQCRMTKNLMAKEDLSNLGFTEEAKVNAINAANRHAGARKEKTGFIAGMYIKGERNRPTS